MIHGYHNPHKYTKKQAISYEAHWRYWNNHLSGKNRPFRAYDFRRLMSSVALAITVWWSHIPGITSTGLTRSGELQNKISKRLFFRVGSFTCCVSPKVSTIVLSSRLTGLPAPPTQMSPDPYCTPIYGHIWP